MYLCRLVLIILASAALTAGFAAQSPAASSPQSQSAAPGSVAKLMGTVKTIDGNTLTVVSDSKAETPVLVQEATRIVRTAPGQTDLKNAMPETLAEVQTGDRVLVRGKLSDDGKSFTASSIIVMKQSDIAERQKKEQEDWQKRGVGGLVTEVNAGGGTVTVSNTVAGVKKTTVVHVATNTIIRRYAPDSVKFDDAKPGTLDQIKAGDQLRARGTHGSDGGDLNAEEIVSGSFRNIAGLITAVDAADGKITVNDVLTGKPTTVKIAGDSQLKKIPPMLAQRIAARLKGAPAGGPAPGGADSAGAHSAASGVPGGPPGTPSAADAGGARAGAGGDMQQLLNRLPDATLSELQKGDAVMIVSTEGSASSAPTAITLLGGVEAILTASPRGGAMMMSPWSLGSSISDAMTQ
jgi:Domain of unknown function (DUF5666)